MGFKTNVHPRVEIGPQVDRPIAPSEDGLIYVSQTAISAWDSTAHEWRSSTVVASVFILDANGTDGEYHTWAAFYADYALAVGPSVVYIRGLFPVPAGTYAIRPNTIFSAVDGANIAADTNVLEFQDGAVLDCEQGIQFQAALYRSVSNSPCLTFDSTNFPFVEINQLAEFQANGGSPMINWTIPQSQGALIVATLLGTKLRSSPSPIIALNGANFGDPAVMLLFAGGPQTEVQTNAIASNANAFIQVLIGTLPSFVASQAGYLGQGTPFVDPTLSANSQLDMNNRSIKGVQGLSGTTSNFSRNLRGTVVLPGAAVVSVAFGTAEPDSNYRIALGSDTNETFWWSNKTGNGFDINSSNALSIANVDWHLIR